MASSRKSICPQLDISQPVNIGWWDEQISWNENHDCRLKGWRWQKWDPCAILSALKCLQHVRRSWERQNRISLFLSLHGWSFFTISPRVLCWNENDCRAISNIICGREISALRLDLFRSHAWKKSHGIVVKWLPKMNLQDLYWINKWSVPSLSYPCFYWSYVRSKRWLIIMHLDRFR